MSNKLAPLRGMKDLLPEDFRLHQYIEKTAQRIAGLYGYEGIATPILENAAVFDRTLGDSSDVISKEMYSFSDKKGRIIALRPEFTASVVRAFISNGLKQRLPLRLFSSGPLFRYDRPQEGRQRQFHQLNFEYIGAKGAYSDAETIAMAARLLKEFGLYDHLRLELNSLGCSESREAYHAALIEYFSRYESDLSSDSKQRLHRNPLRILDSKEEVDKKISQDAPVITAYYTEEAANYFNKVKSHLEMLGVEYIENPRLARGLDYYSHTAFEFITDKLGAQGTLLAGGRYDGLTKLMGESEIPSIGFAAGIERIALLGLSLGKFALSKQRGISIIPIGSSESYPAIIAEQLRDLNIEVTILFDGKVGKRLQTAISDNAQYAIFVGDEEEKKQTFKLKDLDENTEKELKISELKKIF